MESVEISCSERPDLTTDRGVRGQFESRQLKDKMLAPFCDARGKIVNGVASESCVDIIDRVVLLSDSIATQHMPLVPGYRLWLRA